MMIFLGYIAGSSSLLLLMLVLEICGLFKLTKSRRKTYEILKKTDEARPYDETFKSAFLLFELIDPSDIISPNTIKDEIDWLNLIITILKSSGLMIVLGWLILPGLFFYRGDDPETGMIRYFLTLKERTETIKKNTAFVLDHKRKEQDAKAFKQNMAKIYKANRYNQFEKGII